MPNKFIFNFKNKCSREIDNADKALHSVEAYLASGTPFELAIPKSCVEFIRQIEKLIDELGDKVKLDDSSDPEAIDYLLNSVFFGSIGSLQGAAFGSSLWLAIVGALTAAAKAGIAGVVLPQSVPFVVAGSVVGGIGGVASGLLYPCFRLKISSKSSLIMFDKADYIFLSFEPQS
jgi:hypothetical protein